MKTVGKLRLFVQMLVIALMSLAAFNTRASDVDDSINTCFDDPKSCNILELFGDNDPSSFPLNPEVFDLLGLDLKLIDPDKDAELLEGLKKELELHFSEEDTERIFKSLKQQFSLKGQLDVDAIENVLNNLSINVPDALKGPGDSNHTRSAASALLGIASGLNSSSSGYLYASVDDFDPYVYSSELGSINSSQFSPYIAKVSSLVNGSREYVSEGAIQTADNNLTKPSSMADVANNGPQSPTSTPTTANSFSDSGASSFDSAPSNVVSSNGVSAQNDSKTSEASALNKPKNNDVAKTNKAGLDDSLKHGDGTSAVNRQVAQRSDPLEGLENNLQASDEFTDRSPASKEEGLKAEDKPVSEVPKAKRVTPDNQNENNSLLSDIFKQNMNVDGAKVSNVNHSTGSIPNQNLHQSVPQLLVFSDWKNEKISDTSSVDSSRWLGDENCIKFYKEISDHAKSNSSIALDSESQCNYYYSKWNKYFKDKPGSGRACLVRMGSFHKASVSMLGTIKGGESKSELDKLFEATRTEAVRQSAAEDLFISSQLNLASVTKNYVCSTLNVKKKEQFFAKVKRVQENPDECQFGSVAEKLKQPIRESFSSISALHEENFVEINPFDSDIEKYLKTLVDKQSTDTIVHNVAEKIWGHCGSFNALCFARINDKSHPEGSPAFANIEDLRGYVFGHSTTKNIDEGIIKQRQYLISSFNMMKEFNVLLATGCVGNMDLYPSDDPLIKAGYVTEGSKPDVRQSHKPGSNIDDLFPSK